MKLLKAKEVQKPSVSGGIFCILFAAVGKKYAVGDKKDDGPPEAKEKAVEPLHSRKNKMKKAL